MKKSIKFYLLIFLLLLALPFKVNALEDTINLINDNSVLPLESETLFIEDMTDIGKDFDYYLSSYDVNIKVNENNTFHIEENIDAEFNIPKHGIIRNIPLKNNVNRLDGSSSTAFAKVKNLSVNNEYTTNSSNQMYNIKIGSKTNTITGHQNYIIGYDYILGKDDIKEYDEFYFNIIGDGWDTIIGNITFTIEMPKEFDESKLGFSSGPVGSTYSGDITYEVDGNVIKGSHNRYLSSEESLTVRLTLDEGYFSKAKAYIDPNITIILVVPIVFLLISFFIWYFYGKDEKPIETVEFYPPEGFNSLELGYSYHGKAYNRDVLSLLIYLANKGYIKITETKSESDEQIKITKLKEYDGNNSFEKIFFNGLFKDKNEVTIDKLKNKFYKTMDKILVKIDSKTNKRKLYVDSSKKHVIIMSILMIVSLIVNVSGLALEYGSISDLENISGIMGVYIVLLLSGIFTNKMDENSKITVVGFFTLLFFLIFTRGMLEIAAYNLICLLAILVGALCFIGMVALLFLMSKRTPYGTQILGRIKGFKNFLETAEKEKLEALVSEDPSYFYNILPYTYVLGVSDIWIKKFEEITFKEPDWYSSSTEFNVTSFGSTINSTISSISHTMSSYSSDFGGSSGGGSSGGGSSGGGSSGGGSGGGGGSSW